MELLEAYIRSNLFSVLNCKNVLLYAEVDVTYLSFCVHV